MSVNTELKIRKFLWIVSACAILFLGYVVVDMKLRAIACVETPLSEYACEVEYKDYSWTLVRQITDQICMPQHGRCIGVVKGQYAAHNLDWLMLDEVEAVIRVKASNKRQASIGVSSCNPFLTKEDLKNTQFRLTNLILPAMTVDGVNESGVFACVNSAPKGEGLSDSTQWEYGKLTTTGTNPNSLNKLCTVLLVRYILDHAHSACRENDPRSAWRLINEVNWYAPSSEYMNEEFHWLIADRDSCFILEFIDNKPVMVRNEHILSNFYVGVNGGEQPHGEGYERYHVAKKHYDEIESVDGMMHVLEHCWYSKLYQFSPTDTLRFRYSDILLRRPEGEITPEFVALCDSLVSDETSIPDRDPECKRWATRHSVVYDLENLTLNICFDESKEVVTRTMP